MNLKEALITLKTRCLSTIQEAATVGDTARVIDLSELLRRIEADERETDALESHLTNYKASLNGRDTVEGEVNTRPLIRLNAVSPRQHGKELRERLANQHSLKPEKGAIYRGPSGSRVGIATARERKPNNWFLGLPDTQLDCAVLLCEPNSGELLEFVLPREFIRDLWGRLSRNAGQVKFNVNKRNGGYQLQVPGGVPLDIRPFLGQHAPLH